MNKAILSGRMTKDPEAKKTQNGTSCAQFTLAVDRGYKDANGNRQTDFINCVAWRNTAEFVSKYFKKGSPALITGMINTRTYDDKDGKKVYVTEVVAENVEFFSTVKTEEQTAPAQPPVAPPVTVAPVEEFPDPTIDLPFEV